MENLTVKSLEHKTIQSSGKPFIKATLARADGTEVKDVAIWDSFPGFASIAVGSVLFAQVEEKPGKGSSLKATGSSPRRPAGGMSPAAVEMAQVRKHQHMDKVIDQKEASIQLAGAMRDATLIVTAFYPEFTTLPRPERDNKILEQIEAWRDILLTTWDEGRAKSAQELAATTAFDGSDREIH